MARKTRRRHRGGSATKSNKGSSNNLAAKHMKGGKRRTKRKGHKRKGGFAAELHKALLPFGLFAAQKGYSRTRKVKGGKKRRRGRRC